MNDATAENVERKTLNAITQEITNRNKHMPELEDIKAIYYEFMPWYKAVVIEKARMFILYVETHQERCNSRGSDSHACPHLNQLMYICSYYAKKVEMLKWPDPSGSEIFLMHLRVGNS
jgi:hypothetical protein